MWCMAPRSISKLHTPGMSRPSLPRLREPNSNPSMQLRWIALLEPWYQGSHRAWADALVDASTHHIELIAHPVGPWRRVLRDAPMWFSSRLEEAARELGPPSVVLASSPIDLASVLGLSRAATSGAQILLFQHESQMLYPPGPKGGIAIGPGVVDWHTFAAADRIFVASRYHHREINERLAGFVAEHTDPSQEPMVRKILDRLAVLPVGIDYTSLAADRPSAKNPEPPCRIVWNHRWDHDKAPHRFVHALSVLHGRGANFELVLLGDSSGAGSDIRALAEERLAGHIVHSGAATKADYVKLLQSSDVVVSTSDHDFFGVAAAEAIAAGCRPLLPDRLGYPELVPQRQAEHFLYRDDEFIDRLGQLTESSRSELHAHSEVLLTHIRQFSWEHLIQQYDAVLAKARARNGR
jgi:glycosyltransferase involved in cell wall biosynthesis